MNLCRSNTRSTGVTARYLSFYHLYYMLFESDLGCNFPDLVEDLGCIFVSRYGGGRSGQL
ncbi:hypothetical protein HanIR_Chr17g0882851 [Helianthus annuus]|nr:hypothetical protein HanIR_Chr17g0882851 [Helianthus annuus]